MSVSDHTALPCPRCRYDLRGQEQPRCPECGLLFSLDQWEAGILRENRATMLDRVDLWQPHQVLLAAMWDLVGNALRPLQSLLAIDVRGPVRSAVLMLVIGVGWLYAIGTVVLSVALYLREPISPHLSLKVAGLVWMPQLLGLALIVPVVSGLLICDRGLVRVARVDARASVRLVCYWVPMAAAWGVVFSLVVMLGLGGSGAAGLVAAVLPVLPVLAPSGRGSLRGRARFPVVRLAALGVLCVGWAVGSPWLGDLVLPESLAQSIWQGL